MEKQNIRIMNCNLAPTVQITEVITPCESLSTPYKCVDSFIANRYGSGDQITVRGSARQGGTDISSEIQWTCADNPDDNIVSGTCSPATGMGATFTFIPKPPTATTGRTKPLSYRVTATIGTDIKATRTITQDELDELRQEYEDMPERESQGRVYFDQDPAQLGYERLLDAPDIENGRHQWHILSRYNLNQHAVDLDNSYAGNLRVSAGYRCPRGNARAGGALKSNHQYGMALDFSQQSTQENYRVWSAASNASHRFLYDQNDKIVNNSLIIQYPWPLMPPGVTAYTHGHADWQ
jgi:hypothetical protein